MARNGDLGDLEKTCNNSEKLARNSDLLKTLIGKYSEKLARNSNFVKTCNKPEKTGQN